MTATSYFPADAQADTTSMAVKLWLGTVAFMIFVMVVVGGATRLTGSGLSITEWQPILGVIPPLSAADWQIAFDKYREIPQYQLINRGMSLEEFQFIYWWEWGHRVLGRAIGVAFAVPLVVFALLGMISRPLAPRLLLLLLLGGLQGFMGWYMVQSGLVDRVSVSQYRLAAHLGLAAIIFAGVIWVMLGVGRQRIVNWSWQHTSACVLLSLVFVQIIAGAFVAGLKAGFTYNTWPLMDGQIVPAGLLTMSPWWTNLFENIATVQFSHRVAAYVLVVYALVHAALLWRARSSAASSAMLIGLAIFVQAAIGVWTLLWVVPLGLGLVHQAGAFIVLALGVFHLHALSAPVQDRR
jgi:cytochrome c oxidase assembly protein subunit 15